MNALLSINLAILKCAFEEYTMKVQEFVQKIKASSACFDNGPLTYMSRDMDEDIKNPKKLAPMKKLEWVLKTRM